MWNFGRVTSWGLRFVVVVVLMCRAESLHRPNLAILLRLTFRVFGRRKSDFSLRFHLSRNKCEIVFVSFKKDNRRKAALNHIYCRCIPTPGTSAFQTGYEPRAARIRVQTCDIPGAPNIARRLVFRVFC